MTEQRAFDADAIKIAEEQRVAPVEYAEDRDIDHAHLAKSGPRRVYRSVLLQMFLFGALAFVGPSMADAISNLGGGGLSSPDLANLAQSLNYAGTCLMTIVGGPLINKIGIKHACMINAATFWMSGTGFFINIKYGVEWWLIVAKIITGITNGFLYVGESTAMLTYPRAQDRGLYLSIWAGMRNSGSVIGGAISFGVNAKAATAGAVALGTYIIFITFESTGPIWALLLSPTHKVRRADGSRVVVSEDVSWKEEFQALFQTMQSKIIWLIAIPSYYSFFHWAITSTYLATHFSVRARALSSFISREPIHPAVLLCLFGAALTPALVAVISTFFYGKFLDNHRMSPRTRAWWGMGIWLVPQTVGLVWMCVMWNHVYPDRVAIDYGATPGKWAAAYFPFLLVFGSGFWVQIYLYWVLGTFTSDVKAASRLGGLFRAVETAGQTTSYAVCAKAYRGRYMTYANIALMLASVGILPFLIRLIPDRPLAVDPATVPPAALRDPAAKQAIDDGRPDRKE